ncbi:hypothetical protein C7M84_000320 [Penaeus vannamei]|uniref:Uncharacterized protein n=1 Tax=Penaeus vannamei TaxID=6689 RepID=A0A423TWX8_PENVA|nr:hypothetical protein C7M84_000320 [Penaeus vannamei]
MACDGRAARAVKGTMELHRRMKRAVNLLLYFVVAAAFLAVISFLVEEHQLRRKAFRVAKVADPPSPFPPVTLCPWPPFNPLRLVRLGLNTSAASSAELQKRVENLSGLGNGGVTGRTLVEEAAWRVEDVVEEVRVGGRREMYSEEEADVRWWHRSFLPVGPCLTVSSPPLASRSSLNLTIRVRPRPLNVDLCERRESDVRRSSENLCRPAEQNSNTSLWGDYMEKGFFLIFFVYLSSTDSHLQTHIANTDLGISNSHDISVEGISTHYEVTYIDDYGDAPTCFHRCVTREAETVSKCKTISDHTIDSQIHELCVTQQQLYKVALAFIVKDAIYYNCLRSCKPLRSEHRWVWKPRSSAHSLPHHISIHLSTPITTAFKEELLYPLNDLVADVGGAMGLLLGASLLDFWKSLHAGLKCLARCLVPPSFCIGSRVSQASSQLSLWAGHTALAIAACAHLGLTTMAYILQTKEVAVSLKLSKRDNGQESQTVQDLVMSHLASRPLGCRLGSKSPNQECLIRCFLDGDALIPMPLSVVDDLNECSEEHLALPRRKYLIPSYITERIKNSDKAGSCVSRCGAPGNISAGFEKMYFVVEEEPSFSPSKLICTFGGIIGFYFGISFLTLFQDINNQLKSLSITPVLCRMVSVVVKGLVVLLCVFLMTSQLSIFILSHPIDSSSSKSLLKGSNLPAVTTCAWPPISPRNLMASAGLTEEYDRMVGLDIERRHFALIPLLQSLAKEPKAMDARLLWASSAWNHSEIWTEVTFGASFSKIHECRDCPLKDSAIFGHCKTFYPNFLISESLKHFEYEVKVHLKDESITTYTAIHSQDDYPVMEPDLISLDGIVSIKVLGRACMKNA